MPEDNNGTTFSFDVCSQCKTICCQDAKPPLTEKRKKIINQYLQEHKIIVEDAFSKEQYSYPAVDDHIFCRFFNKETGKCSIHQIKPETCRAGPITFDIDFSTKKIQWFLKKEEICSFAGMLYRNKAAFGDHFEAAKKELTTLINELDPDELRVIVKIEEPQTFKIGEDELPPNVVRKLELK